MHRRDGGGGGGSAATLRSPSAKWRARGASDPFALAAFSGSSSSTRDHDNDSETGAEDEHQWRDSAAFLRDVAAPAPPMRGKENLAPLRRNVHVFERSGAPAVALASPSRTRGRGAGRRPPRAPPTPSKSGRAAQFTVLGKRPLLDAAQRPHEAWEATTDPADDGSEAQRATGNATLVVTDAASAPHLGFGRVAVSDRKTLQLTLLNPSELGHARIKYDGYALEPTEGGARGDRGDKTRFKCDLHVCVVPAEGSVLLRITFEPLPEDEERAVVALLRFTVNDRHRLTCRLTGYGVARALKKSRFRGHGAFALPGVRDSNSNSGRSAASGSVLQISTTMDDDTNDNGNDDRKATGQRPEAPPRRLKRREPSSLVMDMTPPRRARSKRLRSDATLSASAPLALAESGAAGVGFGGSWWSQRKTEDDANWMAKQEEGFTKWMNYVLLGSHAPRVLEADDAEQRPAEGPARRRFDFSSLRVLAQTRLEGSWTRAASEIYRAPAMDRVALAVQHEIAAKKLAFRVDRPVYADVGLQDELLTLLNNYHPVWLRLGLEAVLGQRVLRDERCTLRSLFASGAAPVRMPRALRRTVLQHLVHDTHVARKFRLVKNLKTPMDGSLGPSDAGSGRPRKNLFVNRKKNITGREYFDALTARFVHKFLMLVKFLDAAVASRADKFLHFPCLFRVSAASATTTTTDADTLQLKSSQAVVSEFCRLFLSSEGRIDKHLKQLGYELSHQQTPLDEVDVQIRNLAVDLRDGVRLAKLMEALTSSASASSSSDAVSPATAPLSSFLRVPALSRLQKVHNVEICLHFLQEKCGPDVLASIKRAVPTTTATSAAALTSALSGRRARSAFASLQGQADEKLVETLAKDIVDGHREKTLALLWTLISCFQLRSLVDTDAVRREIACIQQRMSFRALEFLAAQQQSAPVRAIRAADNNDDDDGNDDSDDRPADDVYALLLEWCRVVCANYFVRVSDFTASFADGRALCYLLHYYHPMLLGKGDILPTTTTTTTADSCDQLLANERRHFRTVNERVKQLGEVPVLVPQHYDSANPPEEKMVVTFVCYLQSRLMDSSREIHAASRLKRWWTSAYVRSRLRAKKHRSARVLQRFWFTSSRKRLAIRQCRRLLRAAHVVKSVLRMWAQRVRFTRLRDAASTLQRAVRMRRLRASATTQVLTAAATVIQRRWRRHAAAARLRHKREIDAARRRLAQRLQMKTSVAKVETCWLQHLQRRAARQWRQKLAVYRQAAAARVQHAWQQARACRQARQQRQAAWTRAHASAAAIQRTWRRHQRRTALARRVYVAACAETIKRALRVNAAKRTLARERFQRLLRAREWEQRRQRLWQRVEHRAAGCAQRAVRAFLFRTKARAAAVVAIQGAVRGFLQRRRFQYQYAQVVTLQRNVRTWRRQRQLQALINFYELLITYQHMREDAREQRWLEAAAATRIQAVFRSYAQRQQVAAMVESIVTLQRTVRAWRRNRQIRALLRFARLLAQHQRHQREIERAAAAATRIQACVRGWQVRRTRFDFYALQAQLARLRVFAACWRIEWWWFASATQRRQALVQSRVASADRIAACWKAHRLRAVVSRLAARREQEATAAAAVHTWWRALCRKWRRRAAVAEATRRRLEEEAAAKMRRQATLRVEQKKAAAIAAAREKEEEEEARRQEAVRLEKQAAIAAAEEQARRDEAMRIEKAKAAAAAAAAAKEEEARRVEQEAAERVQKEQEAAAAAAAEAKRQEVLRVARETAVAEARREEEVRVQRAKAVAAAAAVDARRQEALRVAQEKAEAAAAAQRVQESAQRVVAASVLRRVIAPKRAMRYSRSVERVQSWWRGMRVRLHHSSPAVTSQRKKLSAMTLVTVPTATATTTAVASSRASVSAAPSTTTLAEQPLPLGARLEMALHLLQHGTRLPELLFAGHTIEVCTKYSRECCRRCVAVGVAGTLFAAIRGLNRSRPHVELLHQLLLVLANLTSYQRWERATALPGAARPAKAPDALAADVRCAEALVDLLHIHRDMPHVFELAARVLAFYVAELERHKPTLQRLARAAEAWGDALRRLRGLQELLEKKAAVHAAVALAARHLATPSTATTSLAARTNPKVGVSILSQLLKMTTAE
ncbi:hypothetical protein PybrP1_003797 [[Pythium] brassicae (nom. inval.)]|nr:hypothetical protein PybrP1_003797 [[Pythium] brassicae (nom. inval.)]